MCGAMRVCGVMRVCTCVECVWYVLYLLSFNIVSVLIELKSG